MMTNEQLAEAVARVKELNAKRTQGEWVAECSQSYSEPHPIEFYYGVQVRENGKYRETIVDNEGTDLSNYPNAPYDFAFIAYAPQMAAIIAQQDAIIQQQRAELRNALYPGGCKHPQQGEWAWLLEQVEHQREEIEKLKAALNA